MKKSSINNFLLPVFLILFAGPSLAQGPANGEVIHNRTGVPNGVSTGGPVIVNRGSQTAKTPSDNVKKGIPGRTYRSRDRVPAPRRPYSPNAWPTQTPANRLVQTPAGQPVQPPAGKAVQTTNQAVPPAGQVIQAPAGQPIQPPAGQGAIKADYNNGVLNLLAEDAAFGDVLNEVARKANFTTKISPEIRSKRISISLYEVSMEKAIYRLFSLVQEKNYDVQYRPDGEIQQIEIIKTKVPAQNGMPGQPGGSIPGRQNFVRTPRVPRTPRSVSYPPNLPPGSYIPPQRPYPNPAETAGVREGEQ